MIFLFYYSFFTWLSRIADVLERDIPEVQQAHVAATYSLTYSLPAVPQDIKASIGRHQAGTYFKGRNRVVQWLYHDLCVYTMYPGKLYAEAAQALVDRYPTLADCSGTGYDSWREALRFKAKYERRKIRTREEAADYPPQKKAKEVPEGEGMVNGNAPQRVARPSVVAPPSDSEGIESLAAHAEAMKREVKKTRPDLAYIADCMRRTFTSRRQWIASESPSVPEILDRYLSLPMSSIAQLEFELITNVPVLQSLERALDQAKKKIVKAARQKRHLEIFLEDFDAYLSGASEATDPAAVHYVPMVTYSGDILTATEFSASLEALSIKETSLLAAVATQMALYWAFDIVFVSKGRKTFDLLSCLIKVDSGLKPTPLGLLSKAQVT
ncbi:uncharacterized protein LOC119398732 [Rhipicephalus sanguineus]|uniref:uncharacterized protein LOC119398732 n=1 Tax=Rhipicephalus sanguineus TaxID=34632 RepID=UPI0018934191|nr:uncharacterized protein LOC119398732 [Rhipicephalus sanguineus]